MCISVNVATILDIFYGLVFSKHNVALGTSRLMTETDPVAENLCLKKTNTMGNVQNRKSHFEAVDSSVKSGFSCKIVCTISKQKVITFM